MSRRKAPLPPACFGERPKSECDICPWVEACGLWFAAAEDRQEMMAEEDQDYDPELEYGGIENDDEYEHDYEYEDAGDDDE